MLLKIIKPDFEFEDNRGSLKQLFRDGWKQVNVIKSLAGHIRGGHFHKKNKEAFYIIEGAIQLKLEYDGAFEVYSFDSGDMFEIEPYVVHSFDYIQDTLLISMYNFGVEEENGEKDIYAI